MLAGQQTSAAEWHGSNCSCGTRISPAFLIVSGLTRCRERPPTAETQADLQDKLSQEVARRAEVDADLRAKADELAGAQAESMRVHEELASLEAELARAKGATKRAVQRKLDAQRANFAAADSQVAEMGYFAAPGSEADADMTAGGSAARLREELYVLEEALRRPPPYQLRGAPLRQVKRQIEDLKDELAALDSAVQGGGVPVDDRQYEMRQYDQYEMRQYDQYER